MRRKIAPYLAIIVLCIFAIPFLTTYSARGAAAARQAGAIPNYTKARPVPRLYPRNLSIQSQSTEGGLWRTDGAFQSVMMLKNILLSASITVTPILYMADGTEYDLPPVQLDDGGVAMVNINTALQNVPSTIQAHVSTFGSAGIRYQWAWKMAVGAAIRIGDDANSLAYLTHLNANANETHQTAALQMAQVHEGMWWKQEPGVSGFLAMTNTSLSDVTANFQVFGSGGSGLTTQSMRVPPHCTQLLELAPIWSLLAGNPAQGGMRVSYTGAKNALQIEGGLMDMAKGYSHRIGLVSQPVVSAPDDPTTLSTQASSTTPPTPHAISLDSTGMMIGTQDANMQFPQGTQFAPYEVLRNTTDHPLVVQLTANYLNQTIPTDISLGAVSLGPQEVQQVDLKTLLAAAGLGQYNGLMNLRTSYTGFLLELLAEAGSLDQTMSYVFETPPLHEAASHARILSYWNNVGDTDTMITVWNHSNQAADFVLTLYHQQGQYKLPIHLPANGSSALSVAWLIKSGLPDADGNTIPTNITQGSGKLTSAKRETDRLQVSMHIGVFNVRTATCTCPCVYCDPYEGQDTSPQAVTEQAGSDTEYAAYVYLADGPVDVTDQLDWSSPNSNIAAVAPDGNDEDADGGNTEGSVDFNGPWDQFSDNSFDANSGGDCNGGGEGSYEYESICGETSADAFDLPVNVTVPDHLEITNDTISVGRNCTSTKVRIIVYLIMDTNNQPFTSDVPTSESWDSVNRATQNSCGNPLPTPGSCSPAAQGVMADHLSVGCNQGAFNCQGWTITNQRWSWCPANQTPIPLSLIDTIVANNASISVHGKLTGWPSGTCVYPDGSFIEGCI